MVAGLPPFPFSLARLALSPASTSARTDACSSGALQNHQIGDSELPRPQPSKSKTASDLDVPQQVPQIRKIYGFRCSGHRLGQSHPVGRVQTCPILSAGFPVIQASIVAKGRFPATGQLAYQGCWFHRLTSSLSGLGDISQPQQVVDVHLDGQSDARQRDRCHVRPLACLQPPNVPRRHLGHPLHVAS